MGNIAFRDMSVFELRELHYKVFKLWISTEKEMEQLKSKKIDTYKESVQSDFDVRILFQKGIELHEKLVSIDNELQLRIWEGRID